MVMLGFWAPFQRGYEEHALSDDGIIVVRWMDNSVVTTASTVHGVEPMSSGGDAQ